MRNHDADGPDPAPTPDVAGFGVAWPAAHLALLNEASRALVSARSTEEVCAVVQRAAERLIEHDIFWIGLYDEPGGVLRIEYYVEMGTRYPATVRALNHPLQRRLLELAEPLFLPTREAFLAASSGRLPRFDEVKPVVESALYVPLRNEGRLGVLAVQRYRPHAWDDEAIKAAELLANQATAALENARLWHSLHEALAAQKKLVETARDLHARLDEREVAEVIARELRRVVPCRRSARIQLLDDSRAWLETIYAEGSGAPISAERRPSDAGVAGHALRTREPVLLYPDDDLSLAWRIEGAGEQPHAILALPLVGHRDLVGVMTLTREATEPPFDQREMDLAMAFADQAASAIENARLYQKARTQADHDSLTGLLNHRALYQALDRHVKLAQRAQRPLSLFMFDLDRFKGVNDTYGHLMGDRVLARVAAILAATCRETDLIARYGGEEFVVVFPDTDEAGALVTAERIRHAFAEQEFIPNEAGALELRISGGLASYPSDGLDAHGLLAVADSRLYASKRAGGNRITARGTSLGEKAASTDVDGPLESIIEAIDSRDRYTRRHAEQVTTLALALARRLRLGDEVLAAVGKAGRLLDIGKIAVPPAILAKTGALAPEEITLIRQHPVLGTALAQQFVTAETVRAAIRSHHENWDGSGYPDGLAGEAIPLLARLFAVADSYAAMTVERPYRPALAPAEAGARLRAGAGKRYDPAIVTSFLRMLDEQPLDQHEPDCAPSCSAADD